MKIILTGIPGVGKSTILTKVLDQLEQKNKNIIGCIVKEIKKNQKRSGFSINYIPSGKETILADKEKLLSSQFISDFSVNIEAIENELIPFMYEMKEVSLDTVLIFDEIGRMQNLAPNFIKAVDCLMKAKQLLIGTIVYDDEIWARKYKQNNESFFIVINEKNRDFVPTLILSILQSFSCFSMLNDGMLIEVLSLFNRYMSQGKFLEILKLFDHTIPYLSDNRVEYDKNSDSYNVQGDHSLRTVNKNEEGYSCTCEFHYNQGKNMRECSHIQAVSILCKAALRYNIA